MEIKYCVILLLSFFTEFVYSQNWELAKEKDGVTVYTRISQTSQVKDARALVTVNSTNLVSAFNYFIDFNNHNKWLYRVAVSKILSQPSDTVFVVYYRATAPWPVQDRDVILRYKISRGQDSVKIESIVVPDFIPEENNVVRIRDAGSYWILKDNRKGGIDVEYFNYANPGGALPVWMANLAATKIPFQSLMMMKSSLTGKDSVLPD